MKWKLLFFLGFFMNLSLYTISAEEEKILLKGLLIEGNTITRSEYILSFVTLKEGESYDLDSIMDEINISRENLENTNLFYDIFFNDELDDEDNLILTIQLKEKNYLLFGPSGYLGYENTEFYFRNSLYVSYINLFGNASNIYIEIPFYENQGLIFELQGKLGNVRYNIELDYLYLSQSGMNSLKFMPGLAFELKKDLFTGMNLLINSYSFNSIALFPYIEGGFNERYKSDVKRWYYFIVSPFYGYNFTGSSFYGIESKMNHYWDLFLKIVYTLKVKANIQGGEVPNNLVFKSDVRGTRFDRYSGDKKISLTNEIHVPLPWDNNIVFVPFLDTNFIGYDTLEVLFGGGIGVHWYNKYMDPLVVDIAFGKGIMVNFQKRY